MLSEHRSRERRRLRKSQSATVVLRRGAEASQESSNALAGHVGARTAATVAYGNARVTMPVDAMQSLESRSRNATHRPTSEGSHFARNRSKERNTHRGYTHRDSRQSRPQVRVSRSLQSLAHRASFKTLNLCGGDHTRTEQKSPGVTEVPHAADLYAQGPRQIRPRTKNPNPPTRSSDIKTSAERLEAARDAELLQHHHHHGLRHLRSFAVLTRRSCRSPTNLHPDTAGLCNFVDGTTAPAPIKRSLRRSSLHSSLRQIPSSLRKLYQRTFKADPTLAESTHARSPKSNDIRDDLSQSDEPRAPNARARNTVVATDDESSSPLADMSRAPTPPPHVDLSSLRPGMRQLSQQKHGLLRERSNATRWSDSDSERTILLRRTLHPSQQYTVYGPCESYNEKSHLNGAGHGPQAIPRRASSKIFHGQPAFDTQRKISLFLKHIGEASVSEECTFEPGPTRRYSLAHIDGAHSGLSSRHVTDARTVRLLPQTNRYDDNVSGESLQQGVDDKPLMSPSIYSNDTVTAQAFSSAERYRKQYHRPPSLGTATVGDSCAVTRWSLKTERRASEDTLPNTSSEWRSWASERVAGLSRDTPIDNLNLEGQNDGQRNLTNISSDSNLPKLNYIVTPVKRVKPTGKTSAPSLRATHAQTDIISPSSNVSSTQCARVLGAIHQDPTKHHANGTIISRGDHRTLPVNRLSSKTLKTAESKPFSRNEEGHNSVVDDHDVSTTPSHRTAKGDQCYTERDFLPASPMSETFLRQIQRGPYAPPSPVSSIDRSPKSSSTLPRMPGRHDDVENMRPPISMNPINSFTATRSNTSDYGSDHFSSAFL